MTKIQNVFSFELSILLLQIISKFTAASIVVCSSITIQGQVSLSRFNKIRNCSIIVGHVHILNAKFENDHDTNLNIFPNLVEITDHLLVFQAQNLDSLEKVFPRLSIIRGDNLFRNHALIILFTSTLLQINLKSLISIQKGSIMLSRLYHSCYINTIDWEYIIKDQQTKPSITLLNNDCYSQVCSSSCKQSSVDNIKNALTCWNENNCQLKCPNSCNNNCYLDDTNKCCQNPLCMHCRLSSNNTEECVSCTKFRDLVAGVCVSECPINMLEYENHTCIKYSDCSRGQTSLIKNYHIYENSKCINECPEGYRAELFTESVLSSDTIIVSKCVKCTDNVCKKDCINQSFNLKSKSDLNTIRNCFRVKSLTIELPSNITQQTLADNLKYLEEIDDYLVIVRNRHLNSLSFFKSLRLINGKNLFEKKFSLFIHTNEILRELWPYVGNNFSITNGTIKFFENPELCYEEIQSFIQKSSIAGYIDAEVSYNFNGYRRLTCSNRTIDVDIKLKPKAITINWNITISDLRRLKGYILSYVSVQENFQFDQNDLDFMHSSKVTFNSYGFPENDYEWNYLYVQYDDSVNSKTNHYMSVDIEVEPFTRYALYLKADLTIDSFQSNGSSMFDRVISRIHYVYSLPAQPGRVEGIRFEPISPTRTNLLWMPPQKPNGIISFYFITYKSLLDLEIFPNHTDNCQYVPTTRNVENYQATTKPIELNLNKNLTSDLKELCQSAKEITEKNQKVAMNDEEKNDIISIEDEIYNLALRPAKIHIQRNPSAFKVNPIVNSLIKKLNQPINNITNKVVNQTRSSSSKNEINFQIDYKKLINTDDYYNLNENLIRLARQDLFVQEDEKLNYLRTSNLTLNATIQNLTSFGRYLVSVIACQNFSHELYEYARKYNETKGSIGIIEYLKLFPIETFCSKSNLITFRSLPDVELDQVLETSLVNEDDIWYFKWTKPARHNGFVYKYNLKFTDINLNKVQGPLCHAYLDNLKVSLNQFLLTEGHDYIIQVQAVTTAGPGPWSPPDVKYSVPNISQYYYMLTAEIVAGVVSILILIITIFMFVKRCIKSKEKGYFSIKTHYYYFRPDEWEIKRENVVVGERIGSGCFAEVHKGKVKLKNDEYVDCAIKFCGSDDQNRQRLLKEANMMKSINTTHIVKLLGVVSRDNPAYLLLEFMDKGDLKEYLKSFQTESRESPTPKYISAERFYRIAAEIADGMLWLSEHKYIHRDLAARNCLISKDDVIKIADLGLSKDIYQNPVYREKCKALLPIRWMSPESLIDGSSTTKSDVWSFGVVLWEMSTYGDNPYSGKENEQVIEFVKSGGKLELPQNAPLKFFTLINKCMITEDYKRISFKEIIEILDPDLTADFKQTSFYHNDFKKKIFKKKTEKHNQAEQQHAQASHQQIKISDPQIGDSDNYM